MAELFRGAGGGTVRRGGEMRPGRVLHKLVLDETGGSYRVLIPAHGHYALFTQPSLAEYHGSLSFGGQPVPPAHAHDHGGHAADHQHDESVTSIGIEESRPLDPKKLNGWLSELLQTKGQDIFRMKGILNLRGSDERFVFQGVHMLFEGKADRPWAADETRRTIPLMMP